MRRNLSNACIYDASVNFDKNFAFVYLNTKLENEGIFIANAVKMSPNKKPKHLTISELIRKFRKLKQQ